jgi:hypothetical protein
MTYDNDKNPDLHETIELDDEAWGTSPGIGVEVEQPVSGSNESFPNDVELELDPLETTEGPFRPGSGG